MAADQHVATANGNGTAHGAQEGAKGAKLPTGHEALDLAETVSHPYAYHRSFGHGGMWDVE
jgi:hypothetical protein